MVYSNTRSFNMKSAGVLRSSTGTLNQRGHAWLVKRGLLTVHGQSPFALGT